jgi:nitroreductase
MSTLEEAVIGGSEGGMVARSRIDEIMTGRFACREFCDAPVPRRTIEQILRVARFAPSGANIQPWHVYVLAGAARDRVSAALLEAHETVPRRARVGIQILRQRLTRSVSAAATAIRTTVLRLARDRSSRCRGPEPANRKELHVLRRAGGIDRDHRPPTGSRELARPRNVRAERDASGGGAWASVLSEGDVLEISSDPPSAAVDPRGADGGVRHLHRPCQS